MNDPGVDEPIQEAAEDLEHDAYDDEKQMTEEEQRYLDPGYETRCTCL
jgi:potassium channel subfamily K, other eukaryote